MPSACEYWLQHGAQPSDSVRTLMARHLTPVPAQPAVAAPGRRGAELSHAPAAASGSSNRLAAAPADAVPDGSAQ